jgi:hypothetical protein
MLYYFATEVRIGDIVYTGNNKLGVVEKIIDVGSQDAIDYACPIGGVLIKENWSGQESYLVIPKYGPEWEDMCFVRRFNNRPRP